MMSLQLPFYSVQFPFTTAILEGQGLQVFDKEVLMLKQKSEHPER